RLYWARWRYKEAEHYLSEALRGKRRLLGSDHPDTVDAMAWLGWAYFGNGQPKKAESLTAEAYKTARRTLGDNDRKTLECMYRYGDALLLRGRYVEAERVLHDALEISQEAQNPAGPFRVYHAALLGRLYSRKGRYEEVEELLHKKLAISRDAWNEHSSAICHCVAALAENYARQGLIDEAEALLLDSVRRGEQTDEPRPEIALQTKPYLGFFYLWQKRYDEAERCVSDELRASLDSYGEEHPITFLGTIALGMVYREQGRYDEAETQLAKAVNFVRHYVSEESVRTAALYQKQGQYAEAEKLHLKILDIRRKLLVENHPHTIATMKGLIALYAAWGKSQEARKRFAELRAAYANRSAAPQRATGATGSIRFDPATNTYTLVSPTSDLWMRDNEIDFSYPEPSSEMWYIHDELHFAHKTLNGDGSITARIESIDKPYFRTRVGVMIRNTLEPASENIAILITPTGRMISQYRAKQLEATRSVFTDVKNLTLFHLKLERDIAGNFRSYYSSDGVNWQTVQNESFDQASSIEISMDETVHIGLAITSGSPTRRTRVRITHVNVTGLVTPDGPFAQSNDIGLLEASSTTSH
ncbi:MAG: tetratricopeptide repeat protein, partial [Desulfobacteraceae bacterium]|nr:tetratricopeptide repeat protein [Desulfobacteraceae bacterium]